MGMRNKRKIKNVYIKREVVIGIDEQGVDIREFG